MSTKTAKQPPLQILRLSILNFGIIEAAAIDPDNGNPVVIAGDNGNGKSTVLNAIETVLFSRRLAEPITHGRDKAQINLELAPKGEGKALYKIETIIKKDKQGNPIYNLKILDIDGKQVPSPARFIESLIASGAALDPTEIMQQRPGERPETFAKRQAETLLERLGLKAKASELDEQIKTKADQRKTANDQADDFRAQLDAIIVPPDTPDKEVDVGDLASKLSEYGALANEHERYQEKITRTKATLERAEKALIDAKNAHTHAQREHDGMVQTRDHFEEMNPLAGLKKAIEDTKTKLESANQINAGVAKKKERKEVSQKLQAAESKAVNLTSELEKLRKERLDIVRGAKLPANLTLTEDALLYEGAPLSQRSTAEQIRICSELATAEDADCRVLFIREGSLINKENKRIIFEVAAKRGWQCWVEAFAEQPIEGALWISAGEVTEVPAKS